MSRFADEAVMEGAAQPDLAGFLMTWCNESDPDIYVQAMELWSQHPGAFGALNSDRRVKPGLPPRYPRR